jgi:Arc/MetJ family transcription regulator
MARTNIDIDEEACAAVMRRFGCKTKRDAVNLALRRLATTMTLDEALAMRGTGWDADLEEIRSGMGAPW